MKSYLLTIFLVSFSSLMLAQEFAPVGAIWHYDERYFSSGDIGFIKVECISETIIDGKSMKVFETKESCMPWQNIKTHQSGDSILLDYQDSDTLQVLYNFAAQTGDWWQFTINDAPDGDSFHVQITVDSTYTQTINGSLLRTQEVTYYAVREDSLIDWTYSSTIIEHIGDLNYLFNFPSSLTVICDDNNPLGLRCYQDNDFGSYETGLRDSCEAYIKWVGIEDTPSDHELRVYPSPSKDIIHVTWDLSLNVASIELYNITGELIMERKMPFESQSIDLDASSLPPGAYVLVAQSNLNRQVKKILVE